jgi:hypothetical protein
MPHSPTGGIYRGQAAKDWLNKIILFIFVEKLHVQQFVVYLNNKQTKKQRHEIKQKRNI